MYSGEAELKSMPVSLSSLTKGAWGIDLPMEFYVVTQPLDMRNKIEVTCRR